MKTTNDKIDVGYGWREIDKKVDKRREGDQLQETDGTWHPTACTAGDVFVEGINYRRRIDPQEGFEIVPEEDVKAKVDGVLPLWEAWSFNEWCERWGWRHWHAGQIRAFRRRKAGQVEGATVHAKALSPEEVKALYEDGPPEEPNFRPMAEAIGVGLKLCPFCGSNDLIIRYVPEENGHFLGCNFCYAQGPIVGTADEAIENWNNRISLPMMHKSEPKSERDPRREWIPRSVRMPREEDGNSEGLILLRERHGYIRSWNIKVGILCVNDEPHAHEWMTAPEPPPKPEPEWQKVLEALKRTMPDATLSDYALELLKWAKVNPDKLEGVE